MILLLAIILFIIFLIYSIKPSKSEEYTLEGLKLSWANKASIEGVVTKWIVTLKDSSGSVIHTYENSDANNLKDFTDVTMNIVDKKEFDDKIIGNNTLELYYNETKDSNKLYMKTVTFTQDDFGMTLDTTNLEEIVPNIDCVGKYIKVKKDKNTEGAERFACGPEADSDRHYCQFWKHKIEMEKKGTGKACSRANNHVIKTQWPTETTASKRIGTSFQNDPNPNTDENVLNNPQHYKNIWDRAPTAQPTFTYELIMNKKNASTLGIHVEYIKLDGVLATKAQTTIHKNPNRNNKPDNMFSVGSGTENFASWNANGHNVGDKIFTIVSDKKVDKIDIAYTRPLYAPGWIIKENGVTKITETSNRGNNSTPRPVIYTYDIKNGKSTPFTIPHQIASGADGWCVGDGKAVHQDVPGCGRICSTWEYIGSKNKGSWGLWGGNQNGIDCPAAELDQVWKLTGGSTSGRPNRELAVGKVSESSQPKLSLRAGNSGAQADGNGTVYYLDRHNVDCGSDALNQFGLIRQPGGKTQYNFSCLNPLNLQTKALATNAQYKGSKRGKRSSALYLDRHDVNCDDKPITQFGLKRSGTRRIKYEYKCGNVEPSDVTCRNTSTPWNQESNSVHYLDRHNVKCNSDEYISKFKLNRDGGGKFRYDYKCCKKK